MMSFFLPLLLCSSFDSEWCDMNFYGLNWIYAFVEMWGMENVASYNFIYNIMLHFYVETLKIGFDGARQKTHNCYKNTTNRLKHSIFANWRNLWIKHILWPFNDDDDACLLLFSFALFLVLYCQWCYKTIIIMSSNTHSFFLPHLSFLFIIFIE